MFIDRLGYYRDRFGLVHRQIANEWWTRHFGVSLPQNIVVHHINGNRLDNRVENFAFVTRSEHRAIHCALAGLKIGDEIVKKDKAHVREYNLTYRLSHIDHIRELKRNWERKHRRELKARGTKV